MSTQSPLTRNEARSISYRTLSGENANSWFCFDIGLAKYKGCPFQSLFRTNRRMKLHAVSKKGTHGIQQGRTPLTIFWVITGHRSRLVLMRVSSWILQIHFSPNFDSPSDTLQTEKYERLSKKRWPVSTRSGAVISHQLTIHEIFISITPTPQKPQKFW